MRIIRCNCGTYLTYADKLPVLPDQLDELDEVTRAVAVLTCAVCRGSEWDVVRNAKPREMLHDARKRIGHTPQAVIERWIREHSRPKVG
jgi:hypothetical protein